MLPYLTSCGYTCIAFGGRAKCRGFELDSSGRLPIWFTRINFAFAVPEWDEIELEEKISEIESETRAMVPRIQRSCESGQGSTGATAVEGSLMRLISRGSPVLLEVGRKVGESGGRTTWDNLKRCVGGEKDEVRCDSKGNVGLTECVMQKGVCT